MRYAAAKVGLLAALSARALISGRPSLAQDGVKPHSIALAYGLWARVSCCTTMIAWPGRIACCGFGASAGIRAGGIPNARMMSASPLSR